MSACFHSSNGDCFSANGWNKCFYSTTTTAFSSPTPLPPPVPPMEAPLWLIMEVFCYCWGWWEVKLTFSCLLGWEAILFTFKRDCPKG